MKGLPPPDPLLNQEWEISASGRFLNKKGEKFAVGNGSEKSPLIDKEGVGGGVSSDSHIHNKPALKTRRKALRNEATPAERKLWSVLKHGQLHGYKFRRQHSIGYYITDFYCPSERLAIELDGDSHFTDEAMEYDQERTAFLNSLNIRVLRFLNTDVYNDLESVCERICEEIRNPSPTNPDFKPVQCDGGRETKEGR